MNLRIAYRRLLPAKVRERVYRTRTEFRRRLARLWYSRVSDRKPTMPVEWEHSGQKIDIAPFVFSSNSGVVLYQDGVFRRITERASYGVTVDKAGGLLIHQHVGVNRWTYARVIRKDGTNGAAVPVVQSINPGVHQIDVVDGRLAVVETYLNTISLFDMGSGRRVRQVLPAGTPENRSTSVNYKHFNSIYADGHDIHLVASNNRKTYGSASEIFKLDRDWQVISVIATSSGHAHNVYVEDGVIWHCNSLDGELVVDSDAVFRIDQYMTRGLANNGHHILVGGTDHTDRSLRTSGSGCIFVLDASFKRMCHFHFPDVGGVMEIRFLQDDRCISRSFGTPFTVTKK
jgi:hypothetical protein